MYYISRLSAEIGARIFENTSKSNFKYPHFQFFLVQKGSVSIFFPTTKTEYILHENDVILVEPGEDAEIKPVAGLSNVILGVRVDESFMHSILPYQYHFVCNSALRPHKDYQQLSRILSLLASSFFIGDSEYIIYAHLYQLADCLAKHFCEPENYTEAASSEDYTAKRIREIHEYINTNFYQPILLADLANEMFLTPQYLSKFIKEHMHTTFSKYLTDIRLSHAYTELQCSDTSITSIALNNGFPNVTAFNKAFREKYNDTPSAWRQARTESTHKPMPDGFLEIEPQRRDDHVVPIHANAQNTSPYIKTWQDTINIGPLSKALNKDMHDAFVEYQSILQFKYARFENVFDQEIMYKDASSGRYNFTNLNVILDFLYELKVYPHIELSYKPPKNLAQHPSQWDSVTTYAPEKNFALDMDALEKMLMHYINRYGYSYVSKWRFEMWLPSAKGLSYVIAPEKYIENYRKAYDMIKKLVPNCMVGGPGFNMGSHGEVLDNYLSAFEADKLPFDFLSFYSFSYKSVNPYALDDDISTTAILSSNPSNARDTIQQYKTIIAQTMYKDLPIYITELTSTLTTRNHISYSLFQGAFICRNMIDLFNEVSGIGYLGFWDSTYTAYLVPSDFYPSTGLVRAGGIPTPALHAYVMLAKLGNTLISYGSNYMITCCSSNRYQVLLFNYVHFKENFCLHSISPVDLKDTYAVFENAKDLHFNVSCENIVPGRYKVTKQTLSRNYGSILDRFLRILNRGSTTSDELLDTIINLREDEVAYYKQTTLPRQEIYYTSFDQTLTLEATLAPHEVQLYEFTRVS